MIAHTARERQSCRGTSDTRTTAGLQRPDRAHRGSARGRLFRSRGSTSASCSASGIATGSTSGRSSDVATPPRVPHLRDRRSEDSAGARRSRACCKGFHNTCRHRGAALCRESRRHAARRRASSARTTPGSTTCRANCCAPPPRRMPSGFDVADYPLYKVRVQEWSGFIFVALTRGSAAVREDVRSAARTASMPGRSRSSSSATCSQKTMQSNWKIFWENYNECLHCPGVHPQLSQLVPIFGRGLLRGARRSAVERSMRTMRIRNSRADLRSGAATWSSDGKIDGHRRSPDCRRRIASAGHVYMTGLPSVFIVGHVDYVRVVRLLPLGPERTEMRVEYLFSPRDACRPGFRHAQRRGFHQSRDDRGCARCANSTNGDCSAASACARRGHARGIRDPPVPRVGCALNWRASRPCIASAASRASRPPSRSARALALRGGLRRAAACGARGGEEPVLNIYNWADYIGHDTIAEFERANPHQGRLPALRFQPDAGGETAGRPLRLRHRQHHHGILRPADQGGRIFAARQIASCPTGRISIRRCSRFRRRPIPAIATRSPICMP